MNRRLGSLVVSLLMASPVVAGEMDSEFTARPARPTLALASAAKAPRSIAARATEMDAEGPVQAWSHGGGFGHGGFGHGGFGHGGFGGWRGGGFGGWGGGWNRGWGGGWNRGWGGGWGGGWNRGWGGWGGGWGGWGLGFNSFGLGYGGLGYGGLGYGGFGYGGLGYGLGYAPVSYVVYSPYSSFGYGLCY